ncbi:MAG: hypothetical protein GH151_13310 [Bacteroidetes bacterium]|nr:hypothetical protein [Bacteroidota bacterium]
MSFYNGQDKLDNTRDVSAQFNIPSGFSGGTFNMDTKDLTNWGNRGFSIKWSRNWNSKLYSNAVLAYSNYFSKRDNYSTNQRTESDSVVTSTNGFIEDNDVRDFTFRLDNEYKISQNNKLEFGTQITYNDIKYNFVLNDTMNILDREDTGTQYAMYLQDKINLFNKVSLICGLRSTYFNVSERVYLEPRFSFSYKISDYLKLKGAWGKYYQFSNRIVRESVLEGSKDFWLLAGGERIPVSSATHYIGGISYETPVFLIDVEALRKDMDGLSEFTMRYSGPRMFGGPGTGGNNNEVFYEGTGITQGIEFLLQKKSGLYTGWIGYTICQVEHTFPDLNNGETFPALHDQTHEFKLVNSYTYRNWIFGGTFIYATGKPYTAPVGGYELTMLDGSTIDYVHVGEKNGFRLPAYHRMDLSATYKFELGQTNVSLGLSLFNVYGRKNVWYKEFEIEENQLFITDMNYLGFTPTIFFGLKF